MVHGTVKGLLGLVSTLVFIVVAVAAGLAIRLSQGPLSLSPLTPAIQEALAFPDQGIAIGLDSTLLEWNRDSLTLEIHVLGARVVALGQGNIASIPEMTVNLSGPALLRGVIAVRTLSLLRPRLRLVRSAEGDMLLGVGAEADTGHSATRLVAAAIGGLEGAGKGGASLEQVDIVDADLAFVDRRLGMQWRAPHANIALDRDPAGVAASARLALDIDGVEADLQTTAVYPRDGKDLQGTAAWTGLRPATFARLAPALQPLAGLQFPTDGTIGFRYDFAHGLDSLRFNVTGRAGMLDAAGSMGLRTQIASLALRGSLAGALDTVTVEEGRLDLGGPVLTFAGTVKQLGQAPRIEANGGIDELPVDTLKELWPAKVAPNPRAWIAANLSGGVLHRARFKFVGQAAAGGGIADLAIESMSGQMQADGVSVRYFGALPPMQGASATASFDQTGMNIAIKGASGAGLAVQGGTVKLSGFTAREQIADISLRVAGPISDALRLIDTKPLGYASALGVDPARVQGDATAQLEFRFPMIKSLLLAQASIHAHVQTAGLGMPAVVLGLDLAKGDVALDVDAQGLDASGKAALGGLPIDFAWRQNFGPAAFRSRLHVAATLDDATRREIGLDGTPFQPPYLSGALPVEVDATIDAAGRDKVTLKADLRAAAMRLPDLNWVKKPDTPGTAEAELDLNGQRLASVPSFHVGTADGMDIRGRAGFEPGGQAVRIVLDTAKWSRTDLKGTVTFRPGGSVAADLTGVSFDARELAGNGTVPGSAPAARHGAATTPLSINAKIEQLWLADAEAVRNVSASLERDTHDWREVRFDGTVGVGKSLHAEIHPVAGNRRVLQVTSGDAGALFADLDIIRTMRDGKLTIDGSFDDNDPHRPLKGVAKVSDYRVVKAPLLARVLTVASLTGIVDVLSGEGIKFSTLEAPFTLVDGILTLDDARTYGTELGLTARGQADLDNDRVALQGTIVPAYAVNSAIGRIPIIGEFITGEKGGGLIAFDYSVKGPTSDPQVSVNPLTALTPGFLRGLFHIFDDNSGTQVNPKRPPSPPAGQGTDTP